MFENAVPTNSPVPGEPPPAEPTPPAPRQPRNWARWAILAGVLAGGLVVGGGIGIGIGLASSDPTQSDEYHALQGDLKTSQSAIATAEQRAREAEQKGRLAENAAAQRQAELDKSAAAVTAREQAVAAVEQRIVATSIKEGTWTVGRDVEPGTYTTATAVTGSCYWGIYRSGSNGSDIIDNDNVKGGFPTVTLSEGQDFTNNRCGTFVKQ